MICYKRLLAFQQSNDFDNIVTPPTLLKVNSPCSFSLKQNIRRVFDFPVNDPVIFWRFRNSLNLSWMMRTGKPDRWFKLCGMLVHFCNEFPKIRNHCGRYIPNLLSISSVNIPIQGTIPLFGTPGNRYWENESVMRIRERLGHQKIRLL